MAQAGLPTKIYHWLGVDTPFDPQHRYVTSYLVPVLPLAIFRLAVGLYALITQIYTSAREGGSQFSFFTVLTYWGVFGYFMISGIHSLSFWFSLRAWNKSRLNESTPEATQAVPVNGAARVDLARGAATADDFPGVPLSKLESAITYHRASLVELGRTYPRALLAHFPRPLQVCHVLLVSTITTYPLIVTVIYWVVLSGGGSYATTYSSWANLTKHAFNLLLTQLDVAILGRSPMAPWWHLLLVVILIACYVGVAYITRADQGFYPYPFLNVEENGSGLVGGFCVGIGVGTVISFMIGQFVVWLRELVAAKVQKSGAWGSARAHGVEDDACVPTRRGPGPEGEGGSREHGVLRGRWPASAVRYTDVK